jgi:DNA polymerase elongation subunit (family B)
MMIDRIYHICSHPIRKVKANMIMKKAQKEVERLEIEKIKLNSNFQLNDLISIIHQVAKKHSIIEKDLQDKIITKEVMVRFINIELNKAFGYAEGDKVIQIGTVFWKYGEPTVNHNNIITLKNASPFNIGDKSCEVICKQSEYQVLSSWSELINKHDPDVIIGYNTFGFDMSFMYDRITDLCLDTEKHTLQKEDLKLLEKNDKYQKFINLGRLDDSIVKRVIDAKGGIINKKLSSSALGDNFLYYFNMPGRVQIDLLKVCQASLTKLPSYKLDDVAEFYISGKIKDINCDILKVDNIYELEVGNYIVISMSTTTAKLFDGDKLKILEIDKVNSKIKVNREVPKSCLSSMPMWGLGKDDITPQDIFRMQKGNDDDRSLIAKYCIQDCALLIRLLKKLEVCANNFGMSNVCLVPFSYIFLRGQGIKAFSLITNECSKEDFLLPLLERVEPEEISVDDATRRIHTRNNTVEHEDDDSGEIEEQDVEELEESIEFTEDDDDDPKTRTFQLKKDFNKVYMTEESYEGALVLKPITDIYTEDPITVLDFSSLYPSEMITSDLSHDRICEDEYWLGDKGIEHLKALGLSYLDRSYDNFIWIDPKIKSKGKRKCGSTTVRYVQYPDGKKGLIPRILMGLLKSRKETKKKMDAESDPFKKVLLDGLQLAYKITANSVYGQIGAKTSKLYKPQIAASTTAGGRERIAHATKFMSENFDKTNVIYGDTDSGFFKFHLVNEDGTLPKNDQEKISLAIKMGQLAEKELKKVLPGVHCMSYEKVLYPFILISKKRYFALKYEDDPNKYKQISMGLILKRRDNAPILKHCYLGVLDSLVKEKSIPKAIEYVETECKKMIEGQFDLNMFIISKTLSSYYKDPESIAHAVLAQRMAERDPGNKPQSNDRLPYVFIKIDEEHGVEYLQGDRIEHAPYVKKHNLKVDYEKYILNQIMKPVSQLFELVVERLPNFPYGRGYYDEMYNIWYNKYEGDVLKTEKKIKQLKSQMVQKLVFDPIIQYAKLKDSKTRMIDEWFTPIQKEDVKRVKEKKEQHDVKIKKIKQISLDKFMS